MATAISLCVGSTAAVAAPIAAPAPPVPTTSGAKISPWVTLSAMSGRASSATVVAAAARDDDDDDRIGCPPFPVLAAIMATIGVAIYIALDGESGKTRISPE